MRAFSFSSSIIAAAVALVATLALQATHVDASRLPASKGFGSDAGSNVQFARGMLGRDLSGVDWAAVPFERSPDDPEMIAAGKSEDLAKRIVFNPPVTTPDKSTVWTAGSTVTVRWQVDTEGLPEAVKSYTGTIYLGYMPEDGAGGENLRWKLAEGFRIVLGELNVTLPEKLDTRHDYIIVVLGDSGNRSEKFTINSSTDQTYGGPAPGTGKQHKHVKSGVKPDTTQGMPPTTTQDQGPDKQELKEKEEEPKPDDKPERRAIGGKGMLGRDVQAA